MTRYSGSQPPPGLGLSPGFRWRIGIIVFCLRLQLFGQDATVISTSEHDGDIVLRAEGKEFIQGSLLQQAVAASQQETVEVSFASESGQHFRLIHAGTDPTNEPLAAQFVQSRVSASNSLIVMIIRVMDMKNVNAIDIQPL